MPGEELRSFIKQLKIYCKVILVPINPCVLHVFLSCLFSRLNKESSLSLLSYGGHPSPLIIFVALSGPPPVCPILLCIVGSKTEHSIPGVV